MQRYNTTNDAIALAKFAHFKQKDQAGFDYFEHPRRVMAAIQAQGAAPYVQQAAILHDVTEDTAFTSPMLAQLGFSPAVTELLDLLDRFTSARLYDRIAGAEFVPSAESFYHAARDAEEFYYLMIANNPAAKMIKLADIADNTLPYRLAYLPKERQERLTAKYAKARELLND